MMGASVLIRDEPLAKPENADLKLADCDDAIVAIGQIAAVTDHDLGHHVLSFHSLVTGRSNHIAISNKFNSAARIIAQAITAVSVAVTCIALERCKFTLRLSTFAA